MAEYKPNVIWVQASRTAIQQKIELFYFVFSFCAVLTVSAGALALQALIADEAPLASAHALWSQAHPPAGGPTAGSATAH